jgi:signal transduction histidine kinase
VGHETERRRHGIVRAMNGELISNLERDFQFPDGRKLDVLVSAAPLRDRAGKVVGAISGFVDITQQKTMQGELDDQRRRAEEASIRKSRFLAAVSHDIRTPANAISLLAELLERTAATPSRDHEIPEIAHDLKSSALSLVQLVSDVLDLTRFDSSKIELSESNVSLGPIIDDVCRQFMQQMKDKGLEFVCDLPPASWIIRTDRVKLARVLSNLLGNAVKFTQAGKIAVATRCNDDGSIDVLVSDTGPGIPPEHHEQIFDEYFQISNPQREKGSGLGLAICERLASAMGMNLSLQSAVGQGTTFTVHLPASLVVQS